MHSAPPEEPAHIYVLMGEEQSGPYTIDHIRGLWNQAAITSDAYYWHEGLENWELLFPLMAESIPAVNVEESSEVEPTIVSDNKVNGPEYAPQSREVSGQSKKDRKQARKALVAARRTIDSSRAAASKAGQGVQRSSHLPYCSSCRCYVNPNVVSRNRAGPGAAFAVGDNYVFAHRSTSELIKVCPKCGERVFSQKDIEFDKQCENDLAIIWLIVIIGGGLLFVGLPFLVMALVDG